MNIENPIITAALAKIEIAELNPMQQASLNEAHSGKDLILLSPTGSGKTLAFLLPLIELLSSEVQGIQALILVPSRELALQIESVFRSLGTPWRACCCYGGHPIAEEKRSIQGSNPAIIIGTPGRVADHLYKGNFMPFGIETLIIDEFDKSLEFGFHDEMMEIIEQLPNLRKRILLSATDAEQIPEFTGLESTTKLNFLSDERRLSKLELRKVHSPAKDKFETLFTLLCSLGSRSSIVFCNHRDPVDRLQGLLMERGLYSERFHGGMEQPDRERALYKYRNGSCHVLISTDLAARGLDIPEVEHIIHYHLPPHEDAFTHRNGRTARWDAAGTAYIILSGEESVPRYLEGETIEELELNKERLTPPKPLWSTLYIGKGKKEKIGRGDVAGFLYKVGGLSRDDIGQIDIKEHYGFVAVRRDKVKKMLSLIRGEKIKGIRLLIEEAN